MYLQTKLLKDGAKKTVEEILDILEERFRRTAKKVVQARQESAAWQGKCFIMRHENNKLRKANEKLRKQLKQQSNKKGE